MNEKELYKQKCQAELDGWKADLAKLKARASGASADAQIAMNRKILALEHDLADSETKLSALAEIGEEAWGSLQSGMRAAWESMKMRFRDAA